MRDSRNNMDHEADDFRNLIDELQTWKAPAIDPQSTTDLIARLRQELPARRTLGSHIHESWPLLLMRTQMRVVRQELWLASIWVMALGLLVTLALYQPASTSLTPLAIIAPLVAALGVALLYDSDVEQMLEIEETTLASTRMLLLVRLLLAFSFNLILGLIASVSLTLFRAELLLWPLIVSWLAPMCFLSALAFLVSVVVRNSFAGIGISLLLWGFYILFLTMPTQSTLGEWFLQAQVSLQPGLIVIAVVCVAVALLWVGQQERDLNVEGS